MNVEIVEDLLVFARDDNRHRYHLMKEMRTEWLAVDEHDISKARAYMVSPVDTFSLPIAWGRGYLEDQRLCNNHEPADVCPVCTQGHVAMDVLHNRAPGLPGDLRDVRFIWRTVQHRNWLDPWVT